MSVSRQRVTCVFAHAGCQPRWSTTKYFRKLISGAERLLHQKCRSSTMAEMSSRLQRLTWLPAAGTLLSIFSCKGTLAVITGLSLMGVSLHINVHVWAAAIVAFALVAVLGLALGYRQHRTSGTLVLGIVGALLVI